MRTTEDRFTDTDRETDDPLALPATGGIGRSSASSGGRASTRSPTGHPPRRLRWSPAISATSTGRRSIPILAVRFVVSVPDSCASSPPLVRRATRHLPIQVLRGPACSGRYIPKRHASQGRRTRVKEERGETTGVPQGAPVRAAPVLAQRRHRRRRALARWQDHGDHSARAALWHHRRGPLRGTRPTHLRRSLVRDLPRAGHCQPGECRSTGVLCGVT